jgi:hypothetical protein
MLKWICAVALMAALPAGEALAQQPKLKDRPLKRTKDFDTAAIKEGITAIKKNGECTVTYIVGTDGKAKDLTADCTVPEYAPYAIRAVQSGEWDAEITGGELFDSYPIKQPFRFGSVTQAAVDPRGEKAPTMIKSVEPKDVERAINRVDQEGKCDVKFTVGADGKPKDIVPGCEFPALDPHISEAIAKMRYEPGQKGGQPTDWPGMSMPMTLTKPETKGKGKS